MGVPVNWEQMIENRLEAYDYDIPGVSGDSGIAHIVQKEAIQNSLDAKDPTNQDKWMTIFEISSKGQLDPKWISITDEGTTGLTGRLSIGKKELQELWSKYPQEYAKENWRRFEALGFGKKGPHERGARGEGKFTFIGVSKRKEMIYDSIPREEEYRVGHWRTKEDPPTIDPRQGITAKDYIKKNAPDDVKSLKKVGTRVIILYPKKELVRSFFPLQKLQESPIYQYIQETWWEVLEQGYTILLKRENHEVEVKPPEIYQIDKSDNALEVFIRKDVPIRGESDDVKVKELVIAYNKDEILPEAYRGIAIQREDMKVCNFDIQYGNRDYIDREEAQHIFGWITFSKKAEEKLRESENTTHYDIDKRKGIAKTLFTKYGWVPRKVREFAREIGIISPEKAEGPKGRLEDEILYSLNYFAKKLNLKGNELQAKRGTGGGGKPKELRISLGVLYPGSTRRVDFNEEIKIKGKIVNDTDKKATLKFYLRLKKKFGRSSEKEIKIIEQKNVNLKQDSKAILSPHIINFSKNEYEKGKYVVEADPAQILNSFESPFSLFV